MSSTLNDTIGTVKSAMGAATESAGNAADGARHAYDSAREGASHAASSIRTTWLEDVKAVASVVTMLRTLTRDDALGWVGLARRRSPLASMGIFGAGVAFGAGAGMLFAPMSGADLRRSFMKRVTELTGRAKAVEPEQTAPSSPAASDGAARPSTAAPVLDGHGTTNHVS